MKLFRILSGCNITLDLALFYDTLRDTKTLKDKLNPMFVSHKTFTLFEMTVEAVINIVLKLGL